MPTLARMDARERERRRWRRIQWTLGVCSGLLIAGIVLIPVVRDRDLVRYLRFAMAGLSFEVVLEERQEAYGEGYGAAVSARRGGAEARAYARGFKAAAEACACE